MAYPATADLVAASTVEALTGLTAPQQDALREEAIAAVEAYAGQSFDVEGTEAEPITKTLDGSGATTLALPRRLISLSSIAIDGSAITSEDVLTSELGDRLSLSAGPAGTSWADRAVAELEGGLSRIFTSGPGVVRITGVWGWEEPPAAVITALRFAMEDWALASAHKLADTVRAAGALGLADVRQGNVAFTLGPEPLLSARAKRQLQGHVWTAPLGVVV